MFSITPSDILSGKVKYNLINFRDDLFEEIKIIFSNKSSDKQIEMLEHLFRIIFAIASEIDNDTGIKMLSAITKNPKSANQFIDDHKHKIEILRAIIRQKMAEFDNSTNEELSEDDLGKLFKSWLDENISLHNEKLRR